MDRFTVDNVIICCKDGIKVYLNDISNAKYCQEHNILLDGLYSFECKARTIVIEANDDFVAMFDDEKEII